LFAHVTVVFDRVTGVLGYQPQELLGKSVYDFYHPDDREQMRDSFDQGRFASFSWCTDNDVNWPPLSIKLTTSSAIAEGPRNTLVSSNLAFHLKKIAIDK